MLFIMGLMMTLIMPRISGWRSSELKSEVRKLAGRLSYLYEKASSDKLVMQVTFDFDRNAYYVQSLDPYSPQPIFAPDSDPASAPEVVREGIRLRDVWVQGVGTLARGTTSCRFYPEGYADAAVIHMIDDRGRVFTLSLNPLSGRVAIVQGDIAPPTGITQSPLGQ